MLQNLIELPDPIKALLLIVITFAITQALKWLGSVLKIDLSGYAAQISSAVVASILVLIDTLLAQIPAQLEPIINAVLNLIVVLLGSWGAYKLYRQTIPKKVTAKKK